MRALKAFIRKWLIVIAAGSFAAPCAAQSIGSATVVYSPPASGSSSISPLASPFFTGQWTVNGSLCAAGQVVQGGSPTTCTPNPSVTSVTASTGFAVGSTAVVDANHQFAVRVTVDGEAGARFVNLSTGSGAFTNFVMSAGSTNAYLGASGQNYPAGPLGGGRSWLDAASNSGNGWDYSAPAANGTHRFYTAGYTASNLRATIDATGLALVGTYTGTWGSPSESVTRTATSSNIVLTSASSPLQSVVPGAALNVTLPTAATGMHFSIHDGAAFTLTIKDAAAATVTTLVNGQTVNVVYDGTSWVVW
jgi:hypothetical protein